MRKNFNNEVLIEGNWDSSQVTITCHEKYSPNNSVQQYIQQIWQAYKLIHLNDFDGEMLGLLQITASDSELQLMTQSTRFSEYIATRDQAFLEKFPNDKRADPLGMTIISLTSDYKVLVTKRSLKATQNPGAYYFIGGYIEQDTNQRIDLQDNLEREIKEELNLEKTDILNSTIKGLAYDPIFAHPEIFLSSQLTLSSKEIEKRWRVATDAQESQELLFIDKEKLNTMLKETNVSWSFKTGCEFII